MYTNIFKISSQQNIQHTCSEHPHPPAHAQFIYTYLHIHIHIYTRIYIYVYTHIHIHVKYTWKICIHKLTAEQSACTFRTPSSPSARAIPPLCAHKALPPVPNRGKQKNQTPSQHIQISAIFALPPVRLVKRPKKKHHHIENYSLRTHCVA